MAEPLGSPAVMSTTTRINNEQGRARVAPVETALFASMASVIGAVISNALGSGHLGILIGAAIAPVITPIISTPGSTRRFRILAMILLTALMRWLFPLAGASRARSALGLGLSSGSATKACSSVIVGVALVVGSATAAEAAGVTESVIGCRCGTFICLDDQVPAVLAAPAPKPVPPPSDVKPPAPGPRPATPDSAETDPPKTPSPPRPSEKPPKSPVIPGPGEPAGRSIPRLSGPPKIERTVGAEGTVQISYQVTAIDDQDGVLPVSCTRPSPARFTPGEHSVVCSATDKDGDIGSYTVSICVRDAPDPRDPIVVPVPDPPPPQPDPEPEQEPEPEPDPDPEDETLIGPQAAPSGQLIP